jgi:hypothetical protein
MWRMVLTGLCFFSCHLRRLWFHPSKGKFIDLSWHGWCLRSTCSTHTWNADSIGFQRAFYSCLQIGNSALTIGIHSGTKPPCWVSVAVLNLQRLHPRPKDQMPSFRLKPANTKPAMPGPSMFDHIIGRSGYNFRRCKLPSDAIDSAKQVLGTKHITHCVRLCF